MQKEINRFAKATYGKEYTAAPFGGIPVQLLSLAVKKTRSWWKCPFRRSENVLFGKLRDFAKSSEVQNQLEDCLRKAVTKSLDNKEMAETSALKDLGIKLDAFGNAKMELKTLQFLDDFELGKLMEESLEHKDVRELLKMAELDQHWVEECDLKHRTLFIVTGIVYSEKLQLVEEQKVTETRTQISLSGTVEIGAHRRSCPFSPPMRETKAPLIFKYQKVKYDSQKNRLCLAKNLDTGCSFYRMQTVEEEQCAIPNFKALTEEEGSHAEDL